MLCWFLKLKLCVDFAHTVTLFHLINQSAGDRSNLTAIQQKRVVNQIRHQSFSCGAKKSNKRKLVAEIIHTFVDDTTKVRRKVLLV